MPPKQKYLKKLKRRGLKKTTLSEKLTHKYIEEYPGGINVIKIVPELISVGMSSDIYRLRVDYEAYKEKRESKNRDNESKTIKNASIIVKVKRLRAHSRDISEEFETRQDLISYEAMVYSNLKSTLIPDYFGLIGKRKGGHTILLTEDLGERTLEKILLENDNPNISLIEKSVYVCVDMHIDLEYADTSHLVGPIAKRKDARDYAKKMINFVNGIILNKRRLGKDDIKFSDEDEYSISNTFMPIATILENGEINGGADRKFKNIGLLHHDYQPRHIFIKDDEIKVIDFKPVVGPKQIDLVDLLKHPLVAFSIRNAGQDISQFYRRYLEKRLNVELIQGLPFDLLSRGLKEEFMLLTDVVDMYRSLWAAGIYSWLQSKQPEIFRALTRGNKLYTTYVDYYLRNFGEVSNSILDKLGKEPYVGATYDSLRESVARFRELIGKKFKEVDCKVEESEVFRILKKNHKYKVVGNEGQTKNEKCFYNLHENIGTLP